MRYPFSYTVKIFDTVNYEPTDNKIVSESGMGICNSYSDAANQIEEYYGNDLDCIKNLTLYEENNLIILPKQVIKDYNASL